MSDAVLINAPATSANLGCGYDVMGLCLDGAGDRILLRKSDVPGVRITAIRNADLPTDPAQNVASVSLLAMLEHYRHTHGVNAGPAGFEMEIDKGILPGSVLGSSAASAAGSVFAANELLGQPYTRAQLVLFAMAGEALASGVPHADNVAPCLMGGVTLVRSNEPLDVVSLPFPDDLHITVLHPQVEVKTSESRAVLPKQVALTDAVNQWQNIAGLVAGFAKKDSALIARSMPDGIVEPARKSLIPGFDAVKAAAMEEQALGCSISGAGPSIFALCEGEHIADNVAMAMEDAFHDTNIDYHIHVSAINPRGCTVLDSNPS